MPMTLLTLILLAHPALAQDRVIKMDGTTASGVFVSATVDEVTLRKGKVSSVIRASDVFSISFSSIPTALQKARAFVAKQDFQNAIGQFGFASEQEGSTWLTQLALLEKAEAFLTWSVFDPAQAQESLNAFRHWTATYPDHFWGPRAQIGLARATAAAGEMEEAVRLLQEVADLAFSRNLGRHLEAQAKVARCQVYLAAGKATLARQRLEGPGGLVATLNEQGGDVQTPRMVRSELAHHLATAQVLLGDCVENLDGLQGAKRYWEGLLNQRGSLTPDVEGAGIIMLARTAKEAGKPRQAQLLLAKVTATLMTSPEIQARALFHLGEVSEELDNNPSPGRFYYEEILRSFPSTLWAAKARTKLGR